jgi:hypothetical protein
MAVAPSFDDLLSVGLAEAQTRRPDLAFNDGDVTEAFLHAGAAMADATVAYAVQAASDTYFGLANGAELDAVIMDKTGIPRKVAALATGTVHIERAGSGSASAIVQGTKMATEFDDNGEQVVVTLDADLNYPATSFSLFAAATALNTGTTGNVLATKITKFLDAPPDATITVTNDTESDGSTPADFAGGTNEESDDDYRARGVAAWLTQRRGTLDAIEQGALTVTNVASAIATENLDTGIVTVSVADSSGGSNLKMLYDVGVALEAWRAAGTLITVVGGRAAVLDLDIVIDEYAKGFDVTTASTAIIASVTALIAKLRRGETAYLDAIKAAVIAPYSEYVKKVSFSLIQTTTNSVTTVRSNTEDISAPDQVITAGTITVA